MTRRTYAGGKPRLPADLLIEVGNGFWRATIRCHGEALALTVACAAVEDIEEVLEAALTSPTPAWRPYESWKQEGKAKGGGRK